MSPTSCTLEDQEEGSLSHMQGIQPAARKACLEFTFGATVHPTGLHPGWMVVMATPIPVATQKVVYIFHQWFPVR